MIDLFKNTFWYIIDGACTVLLNMLKYVPGVQEAYDEAVARCYRPLPEIYLISIKSKDVDIEPRFLPLVPYRRCVKNQLKNIYGCSNMFQIGL